MIRRSRAWTGAVGLVAGLLMTGSLTSGAVTAAEGPAPTGQQNFEMVVTDTCSIPGPDGTWQSYPTTVRTTGSAPVSVPVLAPFSVTITSVTVTMDADVTIEPARVHYVSRNASAPGPAVYSFADPAPQHLSFAGGVNTPFALAREVALHLSVTRPGASGPEPQSCDLGEPGVGLEIPFDLPADGSLRRFELRNTGRCGSQQDPVLFRLTGVVSAAIAPGFGARIFAEHDGARGDMGQDSATLALTGTVEPDTIDYALPYAGGVLELTLPAAGPAGAVSVQFRHATGLVHVFDPQTGTYTVTRYECTFPEAGEPLLIPITTDPGTTTSTSTSTTTSSTTSTSTSTTTRSATTTNRPQRQLCRLRGSVPAWLWNVLVHVLGLTCSNATS
jgi:hypothetical protein